MVGTAQVWFGGLLAFTAVPVMHSNGLVLTRKQVLATSAGGTAARATGRGTAASPIRCERRPRGEI